MHSGLWTVSNICHPIPSGHMDAGAGGLVSLCLNSEDVFALMLSFSGGLSGFTLVACMCTSLRKARTYARYNRNTMVVLDRRLGQGHWGFTGKELLVALQSGHPDDPTLPPMICGGFAQQMYTGHFEEHSDLDIFVDHHADANCLNT